MHIHANYRRASCFVAGLLLVGLGLTPPVATGGIKSIVGQPSALRRVQPPPIDMQAEAPASPHAETTGGITVTAGFQGYLNVYSVHSIRPVVSHYANALTLPPGLYVIEAQPDWNSYYLPQWYNRQTAADRATIITVTSGITIGGITIPGKIMGSFNGTVFAANTGLPVSGAKVTIYQSNGTASGNYTDQNGQYGGPVSEGSTRIIVDPPDGSSYARQYYNGKSTIATADPISVTGTYSPTPQVLSNVNITLTAGGQITGRVTVSGTGAPAPWIQVIAYNGDDYLYAGQYGGIAYFSTTDANGQYLLTNLPIGVYRIRFGYPGASDYVSTYYKNRSSLGKTDPVNLIAPQIISNVNIALTPGGFISGTITDADSNSPVNQVTVGASNCATGDYVSGYPDPSGSYTLRGLSAGQYQVNVVQNVYGDQNPTYLAETRNVSVTSGITTDISMALSRGGTIAGRVTNTSGQPLPNLYVTATHNTRLSGYAAWTDAAGVYTITGLLSGIYAVQFGQTQQFAMPNDATIDYMPVTSLVSVNAPYTTSNVNAALSPGGRLAGRVTAADTREPLSGVKVTALRTDGRASATTLTTPWGYYRLAGLPAGMYHLHFEPAWHSYPWPEAVDARLYQAAYSENGPNPTGATPVNVNAGATATANVTLLRGGVIRGRVMDTDGMPAPYALVNVFNSSGKLVASATIVQPDGTYMTVPALPNGIYKVRFSLNRTTGCRPLVYATQFYSGGISLNTATPVAVTVGNATEHIDARLTPGGYSVSGRVTNGGDGLAGWRLKASNGSEVSTDAGGYYTFTDFYTGTYVIDSVLPIAAISPLSRTVHVPPTVGGQDFAVALPLYMYLPTVTR